MKHSADGEPVISGAFFRPVHHLLHPVYNVTKHIRVAEENKECSYNSYNEIYNTFFRIYCQHFHKCISEIPEHC